jgi:hypothetical protein
MAENIEQHNPTDSVVNEQLTFSADLPRNPITKRTGRRQDHLPDWAPRFITALSQGMSVKDACAVADIHFTTVYDRRKSDELFRQQWNAACEISTKLLVQEAQRRAYRGVQEPVFYKGMECGSVTKYSDNLMMFLIKKRDPSYRETAKVSVVHNTSIFTDVANLAATLKAQDDEPKCIEVEVTTTEPQPDEVSVDGNATTT